MRVNALIDGELSQYLGTVSIDTIKKRRIQYRPITITRLVQKAKRCAELQNLPHQPEYPRHSVSEAGQAPRRSAWECHSEYKARW